MICLLYLEVKAPPRYNKKRETQQQPSKEKEKGREKYKAQRMMIINLTLPVLHFVFQFRITRDVTFNRAVHKSVFYWEFFLYLTFLNMFTVTHKSLTDAIV